MESPETTELTQNESPLLDLTRSRADESVEPTLSRPQLVERIIAINPTATTSFLNRFRPDRLADYLDRLVATQEPRGRGSRWVRRGDTSGMVARTARE